MKTPGKDTQIGLETIFSKYQLLPVLREQFRELVHDKEFGENFKDFCTDALCQIYLHRQADLPTMVGILSPKYGNPQKVADKLEIVANEDLIDFDLTTEKFIVKYDVSEEIQDLLNKYQYPLPMVTKPILVTTNYETGYETITGLVILNGSNYFKDKDLCLDHINRANSVSMCFDIKVIESETGNFVEPKRKIGEGFNDYKKRVRQADVFYNMSLDVMLGLDSLTDEIYLTHKYDRRGRCYASGYHVNTQGTDYNKSCLQFSKKEVVTG